MHIRVLATSQAGVFFHIPSPGQKRIEEEGGREGVGSEMGEGVEEGVWEDMWSGVKKGLREGMKEEVDEGEKEGMKDEVEEGVGKDFPGAIREK